MTMQQLDFTLFTEPVTAKLTELRRTHKHVLVSKIGGDVLYSIYLDLYPKEVNQVFRERRYYDGNYDKNFIRSVGSLVFMNEQGDLDTIWNVETTGYFQEVADYMHRALLSQGLGDMYAFTEPNYGHEPNIDNYNKDLIWDHFFYKNDKIEDYNGTENSDFRANKEVLKRSLEEFEIASIETVIELAESNAIYNGMQHIETLRAMLSDTIMYYVINDENDLMTKDQREECADRFILITALNRGRFARYRNTAIGTLISDLSTGVDLNTAVASFEKITAPENYKRTTAVVSPKMLEKAVSTLEEMGLRNAVIGRRPLMKNEIDVNDMLFRSKDSETIAFDSLHFLLDDLKAKSTINENDIPVIKMDSFIKELGDANTVEVLLNGNTTKNLVAFSTSDDEERIFEWDNNVAWSYNGGVTDAIKERVKQAGGKVDAKVRMSLSWHNGDDLDLHLKRINGRYSNQHVYFGNKRSCGFELDVDMNVSSGFGNLYDEEHPVENIFSNGITQDGTYLLSVHCYTKRDRDPLKQGFDIQIVNGDEVTELTFSGNVSRGDDVQVLTIDVVGGIIVNVKFMKSMTVNSTKGVDAWGLEAGVFHECEMIFKSPNQWEHANSMSRQNHVFFAIDGCVPTEKYNSIFNEFLRSDLYSIRKTMEIISTRTMIEGVPNQVAGFGINLNRNDNELIVRITTNKGQTKYFKLTQ